jgi:hypothetical protein
MLSPDLWWWNAARVEIDHRAREARFRLEHLEKAADVACAADAGLAEAGAASAPAHGGVTRVTSRLKSASR